MTVRRVAIVLLAVLAVLQIATVGIRADREPHPDEIEYLHAAWLMAKGGQLYESFFEHHPPFFLAALELVASDDTVAFFVRARWLAGAFGLIALFAFAALVWSVRPEAAVVAVALLFASAPLWFGGLTAARAEPFAMAFFWGGAALVFLPRGDERFVSVASGVGIALVAIAALWNPKWPLSSLVVAAFWFIRTPRRIVSAAVAVVASGIAAVVLSRIAPFDRVWFFVVELNRANYAWLAEHREPWGSQPPFVLAPVLLRPLLVGIVFVIVAVSRLRKQPLVLFFLLLAIATTLELRFVMPWPVIWSHYFLMWSFAGAALVAFAPMVAPAARRPYRGRPARADEPSAVQPATGRRYELLIWAMLLLVAAANLAALKPFETGADDAPYWRWVRYFKQNLRADETVWLDVRRHPVTVRDASYYWFGYFPVNDQLRRESSFLPPPEPLPFCTPADRVRFVSKPSLIYTSPQEERCFERLLATGRARRTPVPNVFELVR